MHVELDLLDGLGLTRERRRDARSVPTVEALAGDPLVRSVSDVVETEVVRIDEWLFDRGRGNDRNLTGAIAVATGPRYRAGAVTVTT